MKYIFLKSIISVIVVCLTVNIGFSQREEVGCGYSFFTSSTNIDSKEVLYPEGDGFIIHRLIDYRLNNYLYNLSIYGLSTTEFSEFTPSKMIEGTNLSLFIEKKISREDDVKYHYSIFSNNEVLTIFCFFEQERIMLQFVLPITNEFISNKKYLIDETSNVINSFTFNDCEPLKNMIKE